MTTRSRPSTALAVITCVLLLGIVLIVSRPDRTGQRPVGWAAAALAIPAPVPTPRTAMLGSSAPWPIGLPTQVPIAAPKLGSGGSRSLALSGAPDLASATGTPHGFSLASIPWEELAACGLFLCLGFAIRRCLARRPGSRKRDNRRRNGNAARRVAPLMTIFLAMAITVGAIPPMRTASAAQSPSAYLSGAIDWLQAHFVRSAYLYLDWPTLRRQALSMARGARATADTYPAILFVVEQLGDPGTFFIKPATDATPQDQVGNPSTGRLLASGSHAVGYIDLREAPGGPAPAGRERWPDQTQSIIRSQDRAGACGWVVDLRDTNSGDLWSYLAALGPLLNPGVRGGFANPDGTYDTWSYRAGKVYWDGMERSGADVLSGPPYILRRAGPPIAVLTDGTTLSAGELTAIMFAEHTPSRRFGEPTAGSPNEEMGTGLSDGAALVTSIANGMDNHGTVYDNQPLVPDQFVAIDWTRQGGSLTDPVVRAAASWLAAQRACRR